MGGSAASTPNSRGARVKRADEATVEDSEWLAVLEGIDDIGWPETMLAGQQETVSAQQLIAAYRQLIARARLHGIKVLLGTLAPFGNAVEGLPLRTFYSPTKERKRKDVNEWIRNFSEADAVADLDQALADPGNPSMLLPIFDSGDHVHPSDAGYHEIAKQLEKAFESLF